MSTKRSRRRADQAAGADGMTSDVNKFGAWRRKAFVPCTCGMEYPIDSIKTTRGFICSECCVDLRVLKEAQRQEAAALAKMGIEASKKP